MRERVPLHFGEGLDRTTGPLTVEAARQADQRNVLLFDGRARVRPGSELASTLPPAAGVPITDVLTVFPFRADGVLLIVAAAIVAGKWNVYLYQADTTGSNAAYIGALWVALAPAARPVVSCAETYRKVFFAHTYHPYFAAAVIVRGVTRVYDGAAITDFPATNDLGGGPESPRFAGVVNHLGYLVGWGYGNRTTPDRPDIVRFSKPGDPTNLFKNDYAIAGQPAQPVMTCRGAGNVLAVLKEVEAFDIFGSDARSFGVRPSDQVFGCIGPKLAVTVGGLCYAWTHQGPRVFSGQGPSGDISLPLGLAEPPPLDLPTPGDPWYAHAVYDADTRRVIWYWPNSNTGKTVAVCLNLWNPARPAWSFDTIDALIYGACSLNLSTLPPPRGAPSITGVVPGELSADVTVLNTGNDGDETLEVWLKLVGGVGGWIQVNSVPAVLAAAQVVRLPNPSESLVPDRDYEVAVRYEKGGQYNVGAISANPNDWPATQQAAFHTLPATPPPPPGAFRAISRCYDAPHAAYGLIFAGVPGTGSAQIALVYAGSGAGYVFPPAPLAPPPGAIIYDVDPLNPCIRNAGWFTGSTGVGIYHVYARETDHPGIGPWSAGWTFYVTANLPITGNRFYEVTPSVPAGSEGGPGPEIPMTGGACPLPIIARRLDVVQRAAKSAPAFAAAPARLFYAIGASPTVRRQSFDLCLDAAVPYIARLQTNRYAPGGAGGEAIYQSLYLALAADAMANVRITPIVDDRELPSISIGIGLPPVVPPAIEPAVTVTRHLIVLTEDFTNGATPMFKYRPRGAWFAARLEVQQLTPGVVSVDGFDLEHEVVRDSVGAEGV